MVVNCESIFIKMKKQITVVIADNNELIREALNIVLSANEEIKVIGLAQNGEEAIALAGQLSPDVILMDINMSPVNGFEATRKILKQLPSIKIIGLSLHEERTYAINMMRMGAKGYLTKTNRPHEIIEAILKVAAGGKYIDKKFEK